MDSEQVQFGKYTLTRRIGKGGMAEVFLARVEGPEGVAKEVVIKRILPQVSQDRHFVDMFVDEARISVLLRHGNIVPVFDFGKIEDSYYLAMQYVDGVQLARVLRASREKQLPLPLELAVFVAAEVCKGLDHAHRLRSPDGKPLRVVHRDVSPQNVMLSFDGEVRLIDFGVARAAGRITTTAFGVMKGKSEYMSPEQVRNLPVDARSDLFSLGAVLYEMLTGTRLFEAGSPTQVFEKIAAAVVVPPSRHREEISGELDRIVLGALQREPRRRYRSAAEMGGDLTRELYRLTPAFLPQALSTFARNVCDVREEPGWEASGFEEALVGQIGSASVPPPDEEGAATKPLRPQRSKPESATTRPRRFRWVLLGAGLLAAVVSAAIVAVSYNRPDVTPPPRATRPEGTAPDLREPPTARSETVPDEDSGIQEREDPEPPATEHPPRDEQPGKPAPVSKKRRRKAPPALGKVHINAAPWANVYWRGKKLGHTPLLDLELPVGHHVLKLVNPEFGTEKSVHIEVKARGTARAVVRMLE